MVRGQYTGWALAGLLALALFVCSSCIIIDAGDWNGVRYEREVELTAALAPASSFSAQTRDGSITVQGVETSDCQVLAKIVAHARTEERAQELAEQVQVKLEPADNGLKAVTEGPRTTGNTWYNVSLEVKVPVQTSLTLGTDDGSVHIAGTTGTVDARTSDGSIKITDTSAKSCTAKTSDGSITLADVRAESVVAGTGDGEIRCQRIAAGRLDCHTSDGSIHIDCAPDAPKAPNVTATTSSGGITFIAPPGLSAAIDAATGDGSIHTNLPITIEGKVGKSLTGKIGEGEGKIHLGTNDGSITIR